MIWGKLEVFENEQWVSVHPAVTERMGKTIMETTFRSVGVPHGECNKWRISFNGGERVINYNLPTITGA